MAAGAQCSSDLSPAGDDALCPQLGQCSGHGPAEPGAPSSYEDHPAVEAAFGQHDIFSWWEHVWPLGAYHRAVDP